MMIHEVRRRADEAPQHEFAGQRLSFKANAAGHVVCDVPDEIAQELLDATGGAMVAYGDAKPAKKQAVAPAPTPAAAPNPAAAPATTLPDDSAKDPADVKDPAATAPPDGAGTSTETPGTPKAFNITAPDGTAYDLGPMTDDEVRDFAKNAGIPKNRTTARKGDPLREFVIETLKAE